MIFWHLGGALFLFRWIFRDPSADVRFLLLGVLIPDMVDMPIGTLWSRWSTGELWFHTLAVATLLLAAAIVLTNRSGRWRRPLVALAIGVFLHLFLDGVWTSTQAFLWPFAGTGFPKGPSPYWAGAWSRALADPLRWIEELAGLFYLAWIWRSAGLGDRTARRAFKETGRLRIGEDSG